MEHETASAKVNVWSATAHDKVTGPFLFAHDTSIYYLYVTELYAVPEEKEMSPRVIFQQDGAVPHWGLIARKFPDTTFPGIWIERGETCE